MEDKKLVQVSDQEVRIDFALNSKCRANVRLTSLCATTAVAFKVQTSSPHKFLVKPPTGLISPLCQVTFQVILKPQTQLPTTYPRSPSDRFLIKTAEFTQSESPHPESINRWFSTSSSCPQRSYTHDIKLKVAFVGPLLMRHAVTSGDYDAVRNIIKRQRTILAELSPGDADSLLQVATELLNPEDMINLLLEAGLRIEARASIDQVNYGADSKCTSKGHDELHVTAACERLDYVLGLRESAALHHSRSPHDVAHDKDKSEMGEQVLMAARRGDLRQVKLLLQNGADINYCDQYGLTSLHAAAIKGHKDVALMLIEFGLDLESEDSEGHAPLHLAVVGGSLETVEILVRNGANVHAKSKSGVSPLYMATALGYRATVILNPTDKSFPLLHCIEKNLYDTAVGLFYYHRPIMICHVKKLSRIANRNWPVLPLCYISFSPLHHINVRLSLSATAALDKPSLTVLFPDRYTKSVPSNLLKHKSQGYFELGRPIPSDHLTPSCSHRESSPTPSPTPSTKWQPH